MRSLKPGDRVRITSDCYHGPNYPWWPDLVGRTGTVGEVRDYGGGDAAVDVELDEGYWMRSPREGVHAFGASGDELADPRWETRVWTTRDQLEPL